MATRYRMKLSLTSFEVALILSSLMAAKVPVDARVTARVIGKIGKAYDTARGA